MKKSKLFITLLILDLLLLFKLQFSSLMDGSSMLRLAIFKLITLSGYRYLFLLVQSIVIISFSLISPVLILLMISALVSTNLRKTRFISLFREKQKMVVQVKKIL